MRRYAKFKGFMPKVYIDKQDKLEKKSNERGITYFLLINIFLIPFNINFFINENKSKDNNEIVINREINDNKKEINRWLSLNGNNLHKIEVKDNYAIVELLKFDEIYNIEDEGFKVNKITSKDTMTIIEGIDEN